MPLLQACTSQSTLFACCKCLQCLQLTLLDQTATTYDFLNHNCDWVSALSHSRPIRITSDHYREVKEQGISDFEPLDLAMLQPSEYFDLVKEAECLVTAPQILRSRMQASRDVSGGDLSVWIQPDPELDAQDVTTKCEQFFAKIDIRTEPRKKTGNNAGGVLTRLEVVPSVSDNTEKKPCSYSKLITHALTNSESGKLTLSEIYDWCLTSYPYFARQASAGWKNSIRHNLSLNKCFVKIARPIYEPGKGAYWTLKVPPVRCMKRN